MSIEQERARGREKYWRLYAKPSTALVATGVDIRMAKAWQSRRETYGDSGCSPDGLAILRQSGRRTQHHAVRAKARATHCKRGHRFTTANILRQPARGNDRLCRACGVNRRRAQRGQRPATVTTPQGVIVHLTVHDAYYLDEKTRHKRRVMDAHPDRGGSRTALTKALKAYRAWSATEQHWYAAVQLAPPKQVGAALGVMSVALISLRTDTLT